MIINRYLMRNVYMGTLLALLVLVSIGLFFVLFGGVFICLVMRILS